MVLWDVRLLIYQSNNLHQVCALFSPLVSSNLSFPVGNSTRLQLAIPNNALLCFFSTKSQDSRLRFLPNLLHSPNLFLKGVSQEWMWTPDRSNRVFHGQYKVDNVGNVNAKSFPGKWFLLQNSYLKCDWTNNLMVYEYKALYLLSHWLRQIVVRRTFKLTRI